jgi:argininosuccinate synthase
MPKHIVLAYSGGLDTSVGIHWLKNHYNARVTATLLDMGQDAKQIAQAVERGIANGAEDVLVPRCLEAFADEHVAPAIRANALYENTYPLATALARPLIAKELVNAARSVGADAVAHGCTGKGNDQVRIEAGVKALAPGMVCLAPQRSHPMSRDEVLRYADKHNLLLPPIRKSPYSVDENMWGRSVEGHDLEDPAKGVPETAFAWTRNPAKAPAEGATVHLQFAAGVPVALDGVRLALPELIARLNQTAGANGIGRIDHVENRLVGIKSREVYEAPAAMTILAAKKALEALTLTKEEARLKPLMEQRFGEYVYDGLWFAPVMQAVRSCIDTMQSNVHGDVTLKLQRGNIILDGRTSPHSLYNTDLATYSDKDTFHHQAAEGFIEIWSLPTEVATAVRGHAKSAKGKANKNGAKPDRAAQAKGGKPAKARAKVGQ